MVRRLVERHRIAMPLDTHWRSATCEEIGCRPYLNGFTTTTLRGPAGDRDAHQIRATRRGQYVETPTKTGGHKFVFPPGTICFESSIHRVKLDRPELFLVGQPNGPVTRRYTSAESFMDGLHTRIGD